VGHLSPWVPQGTRCLTGEFWIPLVTCCRTRSYFPLTTDSHCADAVLSLANNITLVGDVTETLLKFTALWVQTPSDYDVLIAKSVPAQWAKIHQPVLSRHGDAGHTLYTKFSLAEPGGKRVVCHRTCDQVIFSRQDGKKVRMKCLGCDSRCVVPVVKSDKESFLGSVNITKVRYPPEQYPTEWRLPVTPPSGSPRSAASQPPSRLPPPILSRSISLPERGQQSRKRGPTAETSRPAKRRRSSRAQNLPMASSKRCPRN